MMQIISLIVLWLCLGTATAYFANQRGRDPIVWFMLGMLLGFFGLLLVFLLPPLAEEEPAVEAEYALLEQRGELSFGLSNQDFLVKDWFYYDHKQIRQGPVSFDKLKGLWKDGFLNEESYIWSEGMENWIRLEEVQNLYTHLQLAID